MNTSFKNLPDSKGYFGKYGGQIIPPELKKVMDEVLDEYNKAKNDEKFILEYQNLLKNYVGRPSPLYFANRLTDYLSGAQIYLKREDLNHTGAHKINHTLGEALLAKRLGKKKLLAETGAGQHGVAVATAAALVGLDCEIHMGEVDIKKQYPNVIRMKLLGAKVVPVTQGSKTLKEAVDSAFLTYLKESDTSFFAIGSVVGPHPYPMMVRDFQSVVGLEAKQQILDQAGRLPDYLLACVGGGSNAIGLFNEFLDDASVKIIGVEPSGRSLKNPGEHAATLTLGKPGDIHGMHTYLLQNEKSEPALVYSIASGLDYPGVGPIHADLLERKRAEYVTVSDQEAIQAFSLLSRLEGIIPALESSHAIAYAVKLAPKLKKDQIMIVNLSGRGDKDIDYIADLIKL
ncbi:MAG: tryptophan synthase subunit beta [Patescibacteria group bacterium]